MEMARRRGDFAIAGVAAIVTVDDEDACAKVRLALCGVGETPVDASEAVSFLVGQPCADAALKAAAAAVEAVIEPAGNVHATADYQKHLAGVLTQRAIRTAYQRASHAA
jgi:carbon-monoxide dehydrogenase medium subunit